MLRKIGNYKYKKYIKFSSFVKEPYSKLDGRVIWRDGTRSRGAVREAPLAARGGCQLNLAPLRATNWKNIQLHR